MFCALGSFLLHELVEDLEARDVVALASTQRPLASLLLRASHDVFVTDIWQRLFRRRLESNRVVVVEKIKDDDRPEISRSSTFQNIYTAARHIERVGSSTACFYIYVAPKSRHLLRARAIHFAALHAYEVRIIGWRYARTLPFHSPPLMMHDAPSQRAPFTMSSASSSRRQRRVDALVDDFDDDETERGDDDRAIVRGETLGGTATSMERRAGFVFDVSVPRFYIEHLIFHFDANASVGAIALDYAVREFNARHVGVRGGALTSVLFRASLRAPLRALFTDCSFERCFSSCQCDSPLADISFVHCLFGDVIMAVRTMARSLQIHRSTLRRCLCGVSAKRFEWRNTEKGWRAAARLPAFVAHEDVAESERQRVRRAMVEVGALRAQCVTRVSNSLFSDVNSAVMAVDGACARLYQCRLQQAGEVKSASVIIEE